MGKRSNHRLNFIIALFLLILTAVAFSLILGAKFINCDDVVYVTQNDHVKAGLTLENIKWAFMTFDQCFWHPLVWLSYMLDYHIWGLNPLGYHLTNLLFHILNTILLLLVLKTATLSIWRSALVAALFGIHPLHVESVAWIAERKDVLSTFFFLLSILAYVEYGKVPKFSRYALVVVFFTFGLMSKPMVVTLPFVLLLLDYWPIGRIFCSNIPPKEKATGFADRQTQANALSSKLVVEKIPLFLLSAVVSVIAYVAQEKGDALDVRPEFSLGVRIANATVSYVVYIVKMFWPRDLAVFYPHPGATIPTLQLIGAGLALLCITLLACLSFRRHPYIAVGWLWYAGTLIPVSGIVKFGAHAMADRFTYVPLIGLFIVIAWGVPNLVGCFCGNSLMSVANGRSQIRPQTILPAASVISLAVFAVCTWVQVCYWHDGVRLFQHSLRVTKGNYFAYNNLGAALEEEGRFDEAVLFYRASLRVEPNQARAHVNLGNIFLKQRKVEEALREYEAAVRVRPSDPMLQNNLAVALAQKGMYADAINCFRKAIRINPHLPDIHENLAEVLYLNGNYAEAWREIALCRQNGGRPSQSLLKVLSAKMPEPGVQ
ncbi:MAG: tetratricopeptide repeat protein [Armatimonadetes bacterium]|nr:tetratricopeptide repeat protein [Armatimonadota bacterium]